MGPLTPILGEQLGDLAREHTPRWVIAAIREAVAHDGRSLAYVRAILQRWRRDGYGSKRARKGRRGAASQPPAAPVQVTPMAQKVAPREILADGAPRDAAKRGREGRSGPT